MKTCQRVQWLVLLVVLALGIVVVSCKDSISPTMPVNLSENTEALDIDSPISTTDKGETEIPFDLGNAVAGTSQCQGAPFIWPTWGKQYRIWHHPTGTNEPTIDNDYRHDGIDINQVNGQVGIEPVYAVCNGTLTPRNSFSFRIQCDPIASTYTVPYQTVYVYYTHMANANGSVSYILPAFRGTSSVRVTQGQLLGYQGTYGTGWVHLHISVSRTNSESGNIDPSSYFGAPLNYDKGDRATGTTPPFKCKDNPPYFTITPQLGSSLSSSVTITWPGKIYFNGAARDDIGLATVTMMVSGPRGNNIIAFSESVYGLSKALGDGRQTGYYFDSNNSKYAGLAGTYYVTLWIKDTKGQATPSRTFTVTVRK